MTVNPSLQTRAVHAGRADLGGLGVHALPLDLSTTYPLPDGDGAPATTSQPSGPSGTEPASTRPPWAVTAPRPVTVR